MAARRLRIWLAFAVVGMVVFVLVGVWLAARWWPQQVGPYLPLRVAMIMAHWGEGERRAASASFDSASYTPAGLAECSRTLATMLRSDAASRGFVLDFLVSSGPRCMTGECAEAIFAMIDDPDPEVRSTARHLWAPWAKPVRDLAARVGGTAPSPAKAAAPDGWVPDRSALPGLLFGVLLGNGYDHKTPSKYRKICQELLTALLALEQEPGQWSMDPASQAVVLMALAEAFAMTNDPDLQPVVERGLRRSDPEGFETWWLQDTTTAVLMTQCINSIAASVNGPSLELALEYRRRLRDGYDVWSATGSAAGPPSWLSDGNEIMIDEGERWGALLAGAVFLGKDQTPWPIEPPPILRHMKAWSPLGGYLAAVACYGGPLAPSSWRDALRQRQEVADRRRQFTRDRGGMNGWYTAHPPYGDEWETIFVMLQDGLRY